MDLQFISYKKLNTRPQQVLFFIINLLSLIFTFVAIYIILRNCNRGFDFSDEGYNLLRYRHPDDPTMMPHFDHIYIGVIFKWLNYNLVHLRYLGFFIHASSSFLFSFNVTRFYAKKIQPLGLFNFITIVHFIFSGSLLYYTWFILSPNYNWLTVVCTNLSLAFLFWGLCSTQMEKTKFIMAGIFAAILFWGKFSTSILIFFAELTFIYILSISLFSQKIKSPRYLIWYFLLGYLGWILVHFSFLESVPTYLQNFKNSLTTLELLKTGHGLHLITDGLFDLREVFRRAINNFKICWLISIALGIVLIFLNRFSNSIRPIIKNRFLPLYFIPTLALFLVQSVYLQYFKGGSLQVWAISDFYFGVFILSCLWLLFTIGIFTDRVLNKKKKSTSVITILLFFFFLCIPYFIAVGTARAIFLNTIFFMNAWFVCIILIWTIIQRHHNSFLFLNLACSSISIYVSVQIFFSPEQPQRIPTPMSQQTEPVYIGFPSSKLLVDLNTKNFILSLQDLAHKANLLPNQNLIVFFDTPGIHYVLGTRSPGLAWYSFGYPGSVNANIFGLRSINIDLLKELIIIENSMDPNKITELKQLDLDFPNRYQLIGEATWQLTDPVKYRLWKPIRNNEK